MTQPGEHVQPGHAPLHEDAKSDRLGSAPFGPPRVRDGTSCSRLKCPGACLPGTRVHIVAGGYDASYGIREGFLVLLLPLNAQGNRSIFTSHGWPEKAIKFVLVMRDLRERLRRISLHWPRYPEALGVIIGYFNICERKEGRFNVRNQTFTECDAGKTALFRSFVPHALEIAQPKFTRKDTSADGTLRTLSRIDRAFINLPLAQARDFHCYSHVFDNLGER